MKGNNEENCFHCSLPVPKNTTYHVEIDGVEHAMCCPGCQAVAQAIVDGGLASFYQYRTDTSPTARAAVPEVLQELTLYDKPELQRTFVSTDEKNIKQASLILEGIVCAACVWLNERHISALPGVIEFRVNYSSHRARVRWDDTQIHLSDILQAIASIGYLAHPFDAGRQEEVYKKERSYALKRLAIAGLGAIQVMMLAVALYAGDYSGMDAGLEHFMRWVSLLIATPVVFYSARSFFTSAWRDLKVRQLGMDVPVSLAIGLAYAASCWATFTRSGEVYFDSVTMFTFFLLAGRFLEMGARQKAGQAAEELVKLLPAMATRITDDGDETVAVTEILSGDKVRIKPGDSIPADGVIVEGRSSIDESLLTGESHPLAKTINDKVIGGTVNIESPLVIEVQEVGEDTVLASIQRLLDRAQLEKPSIAKTADKVAAVFVGFLLVLVSAVAMWWWQHDPDQAFWIALSLLVVTCPCALSLATPAAMTAATGSLTRLGVLTTRGHALETLAKVTHVVLDKTGTLTQGRLALESMIVYSEMDKQQCINTAAALELGSEHPVAKVFFHESSIPNTCVASEIEAVSGQGVTGLIDGTRYRLGCAAYIEGGLNVPVNYKEHGDLPRHSTEIYLANEDALIAVFFLSDELREQAAESVQAMKALGKQVWLVSGDNEAAVSYIAHQVGIENTRHSMKPEDKLAIIHELQAKGEIVAMIGDGVNDAPVLAAAQVSIAMGGGTQLAQASADMVLLSEHLPHLVDAIKMAQRSVNIVHQNLAWALIYNVLALPLASMGYVAPWMAAIGMSASSLVVVLNALRLNKSVDI
ncbi:MAG: heavy metal translocating P-type ATPase [Gammaproteobacteria bacterium]|nr:heavy metal translocating P-type ATPase [Gammaproteobacteria bacterium]